MPFLQVAPGKARRCAPVRRKPYSLHSRLARAELPPPLRARHFHGYQRRSFARPDSIRAMSDSFRQAPDASDFRVIFLNASTEESCPFTVMGYVTPLSCRCWLISRFAGRHKGILLANGGKNIAHRKPVAVELHGIQPDAQRFFAAKATELSLRRARDGSSLTFLAK